jgi:hypothetical protein
MLTRNVEVLPEFTPLAPLSLFRLEPVHTSERFEFIVATDFYDRPDLTAAWNAMLAKGASPEKLYQSPAFFAHLAEIGEGKERTHELFLIRRHSDYTIVGFVPVRKITRALDFRFGPMSLFKHPMAACQVLGSLMLLDPAEAGLAEYVTQRLLDWRADCKALYMQATPQAAAAGLAALSGVSHHVQSGWRECHTMPLPKSFDAYLQKFSAKKRYNLSRQVRLLAKEAGEIEVVCIERPDQVALAAAALRSFLPEQEAAALCNEELQQGLARQGMLLSYVIRCGGQDVAVIQGARSSQTWHVYNIRCKQAWMHLSAGTSAMHLALQDVMTRFALANVDFGYGVPNQEFRSTHMLETRANVMLARARSATALLLHVHAAWDGMNEALIRRVKQAQKAYQQRKQVARAERQAKPAQEAPAA